ncbi:MAG: hypothetical protein WC476_08890 [Phycisphaerae bacterium]|jgi:hypothetical protein
MRFYSDRPNVVIYHPTKNRMLTRFIDNTLDTNDKFIINRLSELGYKACAGYEDMTVVDLRKIAKQSHITIPQGYNKADIVNLLKGEENV